MSNHPPHVPAATRVRRNPFFWVAAFFILGAMVIYVVTNNLWFWPGEKGGKPVPALAP
jgi:uncharacterized membrane protein YhaH (DUF805 family)